MKTVNIKGKEYVEVNERIKHFRNSDAYKDWSLTSEIVSLEDGVCVIKATIANADGVVKATGLAYEKEDSSFINKTSYIENCETSAWGRALGNLGIGIDASVASAEEVGNAILNQDEKKPQIDFAKVREQIAEARSKNDLETIWNDLPQPLRHWFIKDIKERKQELLKDGKI